MAVGWAWNREGRVAFRCRWMGWGGGAVGVLQGKQQTPQAAVLERGQPAQGGGAAVRAVEGQAAFRAAALLLWSGGGPTREGPVVGQSLGWGWCWCWLWSPGAGLSPRPSRGLGSEQASSSLCHLPYTEHGSGCWTQLWPLRSGRFGSMLWGRLVQSIL